jgi:hypothetical protein
MVGDVLICYLKNLRPRANADFVWIFSEAFLLKCHPERSEGSAFCGGRKTKADPSLRSG